MKLRLAALLGRILCLAIEPSPAPESLLAMAAGASSQ